MAQQALSTVRSSSFEMEVTGESPISWHAIDTLTVFGLVLGAFVLFIIGLGAQEYFRHTEADRTLIAWEMLRSGNFKIPQLLSSVILTKPPIYYWILSASIYLFGLPSEFAARFPSTIIGALFIGFQYGAVWLATKNRTIALLSAVFLGTSANFVILATVAEIDMTFGFFCAGALYAAYFGIIKSSLLWTLSAYAVAVIAFLIKGPPVVFFFAAGSGLFFLWHNFIFRKEQQQRFFWRYVSQNIFGLGLFSAISGAWLALLLTEVPFAELVGLFDREVVERVVSTPRLDRGASFYVGKVLAGLVPWTPFFVFGLLAPFLLKKGQRLHDACLETRASWPFFIFNALVLGAGLLMLSVSSGKSSRYMFPVFVFAVNLSVFGALQLRNSSFERVMFKICQYLSLLLVPAVLVGSFIVKLEEISNLQFYFAILLLISAISFLFYSAKKESRTSIILAGVLLMFTLRIGTLLVYVPVRNHQRSVLPLVQQIDATIPVTEPLYTVELFERWIVYYMQRGGREVYRLTPALAAELQQKNQRVNLLLSVGEEAWRFGQLKQGDDTASIILESTNGHDRVYVASVLPQSFPILELSKEFPTTPTSPQPGFTELYPSQN